MTNKRLSEQKVPTTKQRGHCGTWQYTTKHQKGTFTDFKRDILKPTNLKNDKYDEQNSNNKTVVFFTLILFVFFYHLT